MQTLRVRCVLVAVALAARAFGGAAPDQVLVLYNADWTEDLAGTEPGQDSLEVARYYVAAHTHPTTGKKPWLLGLSSRDQKAKRLNRMQRRERSQDNKLGLRLKGKSIRFKRGPYSAAHVVGFTKWTLPKADLASLVIRASATDREADAVVVWADGKARPGTSVCRTAGRKGLVTFGFARRDKFPDGFTAWVTAKAKDGTSLRDFHARFYFPEQFEPDPTGPDGVRDDAAYLEDIEEPVKRFLEDPKHRLADGTPLKDHILYMVVCYGLPKQVESSFGVVRGMHGGPHGDADGSAIQQRLAVMYHNVRRYLVPISVPLSAPKNGPGGIICSRLGLTLVGANPYRHPMTHLPRRGPKQTRPVSYPLYKSYDRVEADYSRGRIPHFTTAFRRRLGDRFLYSVLRIDGRHPEIAKAQVDGALYGNRHLTPDLGWFWAGRWEQAKQGAEELRYFEFRDGPPKAPKPHEVGRVLFYFGDFGYGRPAVADPAKPGVPYWRGFYPGSVAYAVRSFLGWQLDRNVSQLYNGSSHYYERMVDAGATASFGSAHGAHDTSGTWWDDQVAFHHLLRGYDLGEVVLLSSLYLDWVRSDTGDPLFCPDLRATTADATPPRVASPKGIRIQAAPADGRYWARVRVALDAGRDNPEMTDVAVTYWRTPEARQTASDWRFTRRPHVVLPDLAPAAVYHYDVVLTDPYGNRFSSAEAFGDLTFATGPAPPAKSLIAQESYQPPAGQDPKPFRVTTRRPLHPDRGEIHVEFTFHERPFGLFMDDSRSFGCERGTFHVGGRRVAFVPTPVDKKTRRRPPVFTAGRRYRMVLRWRSDPVVRRVALVARNGAEFLLGSNNRLCWLPTTIRRPLRVLNSRCTVHKIAIYDDTRAEPLDPLFPAHFDLAGFLAAEGDAGE